MKSIKKYILTCLLLLIPVINLYGFDITDISVQFSPEGNTSSPININFKGKIFDQSRTYANIKLDENASEVEKLLVRHLEANQAGDKTLILSDWDPKHREDIQRDLDDPELFNSSKAVFDNITSSRYVAFVMYGNYSLNYVEHTITGLETNIQTVYPVIHENDNLYLTNDLQEDFFFTQISFPLQNYIVETNQ